MKIAIVNQKGGVGKTTTATTLASIWSSETMAPVVSLPTLIIDLDPQGNVADAFGLEPGCELYDLLLPERRGKMVSAYHIHKNLDVIRSDGTTAQLKQILVGMNLREMALSQAIAPFESEYDLIIFDCAPSVDVLHINAMIASDYIIIPTRLDQWSVKGVRDTLESLEVIERMRLIPPALLGVLPTFYDRQTLETQLQLNNLVKEMDSIGAQVLPPIPIDAQLRMAARHGQTIDQYNPKARSLVGIETEAGYVGGYLEVAELAIGELE